MPINIRISRELMNESIDYLRAVGQYAEGMRNPDVVRVCLSLLIYNDPSVARGRGLFKELRTDTIAKTLDLDYIKKEQVGAWSMTADWEGRNPGSVDLSGELNSLLEDAIKQAESDIPFSSSAPPIAESAEREQTVSNTPPWENMERMHYSDILKLFPKHGLHNWIAEDGIKLMAVECAFCKLPNEHVKKRPEHTFKLVEEVYALFMKWVKDSGVNLEEVLQKIKDEYVDIPSHNVPGKEG